MAMYSLPASELYYEEWGAHFSFEVCIMTALLLLKPYETIRFPNLICLLIPFFVFSLNFKFYIDALDFSFVELMFFLNFKTYFYLGVFGCALIIKSYVIFEVSHKEKVDVDIPIEPKRRKRLNRPIEEIRIREVEFDGGLQGFDGVTLFKDIGKSTAIAEEFYRVQENGEVVKEALHKFVRLSKEQSVRFIRNQFFRFEYGRK
uniref:Uncharacterized protein n=1 Tax=Euplotes harpa TaxID=151035 RepID=A0A7S3J4T6_9SPIT|mmetsp:Transcript_20021/g.23219  ORF Transcript_20021/g.23219 Transcript_20021/m.23219 type:complete len:203 (+) Transcript_20021:239-847(+)